LVKPVEKKKKTTFIVATDVIKGVLNLYHYMYIIVRLLPCFSLIKQYKLQYIRHKLTIQAKTETASCRFLYTEIFNSKFILHSQWELRPPTPNPHSVYFTLNLLSSEEGTSKPTAHADNISFPPLNRWL